MAIGTEAARWSIDKFFFPLWFRGTADKTLERVVVSQLGGIAHTSIDTPCHLEDRPFRETPFPIPTHPLRTTQPLQCAVVENIDANACDNGIGELYKATPQQVNLVPTLRDLRLVNDRNDRTRFDYCTSSSGEAAVTTRLEDRVARGHEPCRCTFVKTASSADRTSAPATGKLLPTDGPEAETESGQRGRSVRGNTGYPNPNETTSPDARSPNPRVIPRIALLFQQTRRGAKPHFIRGVPYRFRNPPSSAGSTWLVYESSLLKEAGASAHGGSKDKPMPSRLCQKGRAWSARFELAL
ncbi:hypothetical protein BJV78DRAFT_1152740 [Lactifluus subvellereus]|nr:hypothetical protein BJV78DRAFT_1152740 [Lactifluus subvellereus]